MAENRTNRRGARAPMLALIPLLACGPGGAKVAREVGTGIGTGLGQVAVDAIRGGGQQAGQAHTDAGVTIEDAVAFIDGKRRALEERERTLQQLRGELATEQLKYARGVAIDGSQRESRERKLNELKDKYRGSAATPNAKVSVSGVKMGLDELRALIVSTDGDLRAFEAKREAAERWSKVYEARVAKVDRELAEIARQRVLIEAKRGEVKLAQDTRALNEVLREVDTLYTAIAAIDAGAEVKLSVDDLLLLEGQKPRIDAEFERIMKP
jgi:hypothetical protein